MADRSVKVYLAADIAQFVAGLNKAATTAVDAGSKIGKGLGDAGAKASKGLTGAANKTTEFVNRNESSLQTVSNGLLGFGAAALGASALAIKGFADFDEQMSAVKATGADAAQNIDALRKAAMDAGREFGQFTGREAAEGIEELAKAGVSAADILSGALTGSLSLAAAGTLGVGQASEYVAKTMAQFQLEGKDAGKIADVLAAAAGKAVGEVKDFGDALAQSGLVANQYGLSLEETAGTLALFAQNSLVGSDAGTSMKAMLLQLAQPTKQAQKMLDAYNISAYDAQGQFVGMAALAEQLKVKLGDLSQEQQNAALKTIFGADAIRAASLLMREGGAAVLDWTEQVSESGFAAQVAATKMDNLKGDLAGLGGAWENLMISMGESGNGPMRAVVQDLSAFVDKLADASPTAQGFVLAGLAIAGSAALIAGGFIKAVTSAAEMRTALNALSTDAPKLTGTLKGVAAAATIMAGAFIAAKAIDMADSQDRMVTGLEDSTIALLATAKAAKETKLAYGEVTPELDQFFKRSDGSGLQANVDGLSDAFRRLDPNMKSAGEQFNDFFSRGIRAATFNQLSSSVSQVEERFGKMDAALLNMANNGSGAQAAEAFRQISAEASISGTSYAKLLQLFPEYESSLKKQAIALEQSGTGFSAASLTAKDYADWMGGKVPSAVTNAAAAAKAAGKDVGDLANVTTDATKAATAAAEAADDQREAYLNLANAALQLSGSQMGVEAAIDDATASLKENGKTLDIGSEKGRANKSALDAIASSALQLAESQRKTGASSEVMDASLSKNRESFVKTATSMGMTKVEAEKLADSYGLIPGSILTQVNLAGADNAIAKAAEVRRAIDAITGKTVYVTTVYRADGSPSTSTKGVQQAKATGGAIWGAGTATSDDIPAWLSNGEFVIRTAAAQRIGYDRLEWLNRTGEIPKFATGGTVGAQPYSPPAHTYITQASGGATFAPEFNIYGPNARQVASESLSLFRHEARAMAATLPGGN